MRKNCFAKKLMAYTMAFAVAFSTVTVSPLFVKEAKAAGNAFTVTSTDDVVDANDVILSGMTTNNYQADTITAADFKTKTGLENVMKATMTKTAETDTGYEYVNKYTITGLKNGSTVNSTQVPVIFNGETNTTTGVVHTANNGNKNVVLQPTITPGNHVAWFKVVPGSEKTFNNEYKTAGSDTTTKSESISVTPYTLYPVNYLANDGKVTFTEVTREDLGLYLAVEVPGSGSDADKTSAAVTYTLYNVFEKSNLALYANQNVVSVKLGSSAILEVEPVSAIKDKLTYSWSKLGEKLPYTTPKITIDNVTKQSLGGYTCVVSDGLVSKSITIGLVEATPDDVTANSNAVYNRNFAITSIAKVLDGTGKLDKETATITTNIPKNDDYRYIWLDESGAVLSRAYNDKVAYNASNRSVKITSATSFTGKSVVCYAVPNDRYETELALALTAVKTATAATLADKMDDLLNAEATAVTGALVNDIVYTETIELVATDSKATSEVVMLQPGKTLSLTAPAGKAHAWKFNNGTAIANKTEADFVINTASVKDIGLYKCERTYEVAGADTSSDHYYNVIYVSDFKASAKDVTAKLGTKNVDVNIDATATLPIKYTWGVNTLTNTTFNSNKAISAVGNVSKVTIDEIKEFSTLTSGAPTAKYLTCTVTDGFENEPLKIAINEITTITVKETATIPATVDPAEVTGPTNAVNVYAEKDTAVTLSPVVDIEGDAEVTYKWLKGTTEVGTEREFVIDKFANGDVYEFVVTSGATVVKIQYTCVEVDRDGLTYAGGTLDIVAEDSMIYTGKELNPVKKIVYTEGGKKVELVEGTDYEVVLVENINTGVGRYEVKGIGKFENKYTAQFDAFKNTFYIDRADNELVIAGKTVNPGESVLPTTVKNTAKAALTYTYYSDAAGTTEIAVPKTAGVYYVKATAPATTNYNEAESKVVKMTIRPAVVSKVTLAARGTTSIKASWAKVAGAKGYRVYQKVNGSWVRKADIHTTYYTFTGLKAGTTYNFAVKPYLKDGDTPVWAKTYTGLTAFTKPAKVAGFKVASKTKTTVKTTWSKTTGATMYRVYKVVNGKWVKVKDVTGTSYTFSGLKKNTSYKFAVKAFKSGVAADSYPTLTTKTAK